MYLKKDVFFVMSLTRLKNISEIKGFCVTYLRRLEQISKRCIFRDVSETSQKHSSQVFVIFQKYSRKMVSCHFRRFITISDKIDMGMLETLKK